eukprot:m.295448 g.295448  ORF g.295448 m.295448 type:complete len:322 (+) comp19513_c1_seq3:1444-2409(+)
MFACTGSQDHSVKIVDVEKLLAAEQDAAISIENQVTGLDPFETVLAKYDFDEEVNAVAASAGGVVAVGTDGSQVFIVRPALLGGDDSVTTLEGHEPGSRLWGVAFDPPGALAASASRDRVCRVWNVDEGTCVGSLGLHEGDVNSAKFSARNTLVTGSDDRKARVFDVGTETLSCSFEFESNPLQADINENGDTIVAGLSGGQVVLGDTREGKTRNLGSHGRHTTRCVCFAPDGVMVASGGFDSYARVWDVRRPEEALQGVECKSSVMSVAFADASDLLSTACYSGSLRLWSVSEGQLRATTMVHDHCIMSSAFLPEALPPK